MSTHAALGGLPANMTDDNVHGPRRPSSGGWPELATRGPVFAPRPGLDNASAALFHQCEQMSTADPASGCTDQGTASVAYAVQVLLTTHSPCC